MSHFHSEIQVKSGSGSQDPSGCPPSVWLHKCTTYVLLLYAVTSRVKNFLALLHLPVVLPLFQIPRDNLEFSISSCLPFSISASPDTTGHTWDNAALLGT